MENIEISRIGDDLYIKLNDLVEFQNLYDSLEEKLNLINEQSNTILKINLILGYREISSQELYCLFELILKDEKMLINSIESNILESDELEVYENTIRGGETKIFKNRVLILGDINPNALVIAKSEIYVIGKVKGKVIIRNKKGRIEASSFQNAYIKIFDKYNTSLNHNDVITLNYENINEKIGGKLYV